MEGSICTVGGWRAELRAAGRGCLAAAMPSPGATLRVGAERVAGHEEEDGTDEWGSPGSERSYGSQLSEREERIRDSEYISYGLADLTPLCQVVGTCHIN